LQVTTIAEHELTTYSELDTRNTSIGLSFIVQSEFLSRGKFNIETKKEKKERKKLAEARTSIEPEQESHLEL
jgi:hypothetical protein